jgi:hypothetical protein
MPGCVVNGELRNKRKEDEARIVLNSNYLPFSIFSGGYTTLDYCWRFSTIFIWISVKPCIFYLCAVQVHFRIIPSFTFC